MDGRQNARPQGHPRRLTQAFASIDLEKQNGVQIDHDLERRQLSQPVYEIGSGAGALAEALNRELQVH
jgi:hypothetical protein